MLVFVLAAPLRFTVKCCRSNCPFQTLMQCETTTLGAMGGKEKEKLGHVNFQMFKLELEKAEEQEIKSQHPLDHQKSERVPEKHLFLLY